MINTDMAEADGVADVTVADVTVPQKESCRYAVLHGMSQQIIELTRHRADTYKRTVVQFRSMINTDMAEADVVVAARQESLPLAPTKRRAGGKKW